MDVFNGKPLFVGCDDEGKTRVNKWMLQCYWNNDNLMFKGLVVPRLKEQ